MTENNNETEIYGKYLVKRLPSGLIQPIGPEEDLPDGAGDQENAVWLDLDSINDWFRNKHDKPSASDQSIPSSVNPDADPVSNNSERNETDTDTDGGSDEARGVLEFREGDYRAGARLDYEGFEFRARLPQKYTHESGDGFDTSEVPEGGYLVKVKSGASGVYMRDWEPGNDDRFHIVIPYRPRNYKTKQRLTIYADGEVAASKMFYAGDVYRRSIEAETLSFEVGEPRNTVSLSTDTDRSSTD